MFKKMFNFFTGSNKKSSVTAPGIHGINSGQAQYIEGRPDRLAREGYGRNTWVYACVRAISSAASNIPLVVYTEDADGELTEQPFHPLQKLLGNPNEEFSAADFLENVYAFLLLHGNTYIEINGPSDTSPPTELWTWRPDRTSIVPGPKGVEKIVYKVNGEEFYMDYRRMIHIKHFSPLDDYYGMSPLQVGRYVVTMDNSTSEWNTSLAQHYASPSGILRVKDRLSDAAFHQLKTQLHQMFGGWRNAGKPMVLEGDADWVQLGMSPKDMDFVNSKKLTREEICAIYRVPPQIVGIQDSSTYNNYSEARQAFYQDTVLPTVDKLVSAINQKLTPFFGDDVVVGYDETKIAALQESANAKYERVMSATSVITINEARQQLGYEPLEGLDLILLPKNVNVVTDDMQAVDIHSTAAMSGTSGATTDEGGSESPEDEDTSEEVRKELSEQLHQIKKVAQELDADVHVDHIKQSFDILRRNKSSVISSLFQEESEDVRGIFPNDPTAEVSESYLARVDAVLKRSRGRWKKTLIEMNKSVYAEYYQLEREHLLGDEFKSKSSEGELHDAADEIIEDMAEESSKSIIETTQDKLREIINEGIKDGTDVVLIAAIIYTIYNEWRSSNNRAGFIAELEGSTAASLGRSHAAESTGLIIRKTWATMGDEKVRSSHKKANRQSRDLDEYYDIGGEQAKFPRDPALSMKNRANCRCYEEYAVISDKR